MSEKTKINMFIFHDYFIFVKTVHGNSFDSDLA